MNEASKIGLTLAVGLAGIALGVWLMAMDAREGPRAELLPRAELAETTPTQRQHPEEDTSAVVERQQIPASRTAVAEPRLELVSSNAPLEITVEGRLLLDQGGRESVVESRSLSLAPRNATSGERDVKVERGHWSAQLVPERAYRVSDVTIAGAPAVVVGDDVFEAAADCSVVIRVRWLPATELEVVDAVSGEPLTGVTVVVGDESERPSLVAVRQRSTSHARAIALEQASPVSLDLGSWSAINNAYYVWCHAPLHAWSMIDIDWTRGGVYRVALERSAQLEVNVANPEAITEREPQLDDVRIHLRSLDSISW